MKLSLLKYLAIFLVLVVAQVFLFNNVQLSGYINPYIYILFILLLPFEITGWMLLILSFFTGLTIDFFEHTPGIHAAATVFLGWARPGIIQLVGKKEDLEPGQYPNIKDFGTLWFFTYCIIMVFIHHLVLFYIEVFRLSEFFFTLMKVVINTVMSTVLIMILQFLFYSKTKR
jgi:rod shape-determining protein MreD